MKKIFALAYFLPLAAPAQDLEKACDVFSKVNDVLQQVHFKPKPVDDSLSVYVFETVMEALDDNRVLFLQEEYDRLAIHKYKIDDYLKTRDCSFMGEFVSAYKKALERNKSYVEAIAAQQLRYTPADTIYYAKKAFPYHTDAEKIKRFVRKKITYDIFEDIAKLSTNKDSLKPFVPKLFTDEKPKIVEGYLCRINGQLAPAEGFESAMYNRFYSAFCTYFDPHSAYFNYNERASFMSSLTTENYSLGLYVSQNDKEEITIEEIVPGGPASETTKITKGDQLLKLKANGQEYSVSCTSLETISNIVLSDSYRIVELTLRKKDGSVYSVSLEKKIMKADDNSVYSYILGDATPIGYLKIPSFYTAFDSGNNAGCTEDAAKELEKLKAANIKGLIIDLQFNGGGSMEEVIRLAGLFIDSGPLAVIASTEKSYEVVRDFKRGVTYSGPVVVLVNGFSASASEFFAGVMQDYNRAVIAGSNTLGKATMQTILPLKGSEEDFVKVTIDKFYRVTGKSSQYKGVTPDVAIPGYFDGLMPRESSMPMAIKNDSIAIKLKFRRIADESVTRAVALSRKRVETSKDFEAITTLNQRVDDLYSAEKTAVPVTFDNVFAEVHAMDAVWKEVNAASDREQDIKVTGHKPAEITDDFAESITGQKIKAIRTDLVIAEAVHIATDLHNLKSNKLAAASN